MSSSMPSTSMGEPNDGGQQADDANEVSSSMPPPKKSRTNTPWTPAEEQRLKVMRDAGNSWGEIAKVTRLNGDTAIACLTDGSKDLPEPDRREREEALVQGKKLGKNSLDGRLNALQDMHYADFAEDDVSFANTTPK